MVRVLPSLPYRQALQEMCETDALLLFQASNCNNQIPAKMYEYLYIGRPVLGLTDRAGDTGRLLNQLGIANVASLEDVSEIKTLLLRAVAEIRQGTAFVPPRQSIMRFSRRGSAESLARLLDEVTSSSSRGESRTGPG